MHQNFKKIIITYFFSEFQEAAYAGKTISRKFCFKDMKIQRYSNSYILSLMNHLKKAANNQYFYHLPLRIEFTHYNRMCSSEQMSKIKTFFILMIFMNVVFKAKKKRKKSGFFSYISNMAI